MRYQPLGPTRTIELLAGAGVFLCGLGLFLCFLFLANHSGSPAGEFLQGLFLGALLFVAPGLFLALGCYFQAVHRKLLALPLVVIGGVCNFVLTLRSGVALAYFGVQLALQFVWVGLVLLAVAFVAAVVNTVWDSANLLANPASNK